MPKSCEDLKKIGHKKSGLYPVMGTKTVDNVYCDFTKSINDAGKYDKYIIILFTRKINNLQFC